MNIPYRTRRTLRRLGVALLILLMISVVIWLCWVIWLERYVVYSREGATLNFSLSETGAGAQAALPPTEQETVAVYINEGSDSVNVSTELTQFAGFYADSAALTEDLNAVRSQISTLGTDIPVMLDVKSITGAFYYSTSIGTSTDSNLDIAAMDQLIADLSRSGRYLIARVPAFRDREFGLNNVEYGLFLPGGVGLWMDDAGCYWLNPTSSGTMNYLLRIVGELKELGFDEVVFSEFRFPDSDGYTFSGDRTEALANAAKSLVSTCATDSFAVSFSSANSAFPLPEGRSRLYLTDVQAADVAATAEEIQLEDKEIRLVFLAESNDTRFDLYSVMRPLEIAH